MPGPEQAPMGPMGEPTPMPPTNPPPPGAAPATAAIIRAWLSAEVLAFR